MVNTKIIRNKISSINNTKKITKTMEMVAITKFKKSHIQLLLNQPYLHSLKEIIFHFLNGKIQNNHFFFKEKKIIKNIGIIIVSTNRGLCGSLNNNIFKKALSIIKKNFYKNIQCHLYILGEKGSLFFNHSKIYHICKKIAFQNNIQYSDLLPLVNKLIVSYQNHNIDKLFIISNKFYNSISHIAEIFQILPVTLKNFSGKKYTTYHHWDYLYESNASYTVQYILKKYVLFQLFQLILENIVSEQSARRIAMKTATDNSKNIIKDLQTLYNKMRQFSITQELIEIVSGTNIFL